MPNKNVFVVLLEVRENPDGIGPHLPSSDALSDYLRDIVDNASGDPHHLHDALVYEMLDDLQADLADGLVRIDPPQLLQPGEAPLLLAPRTRARQLTGATSTSTSACAASRTAARRCDCVAWGASWVVDWRDCPGVGTSYGSVIQVLSTRPHTGAFHAQRGGGTRRVVWYLGAPPATEGRACCSHPCPHGRWWYGTLAAH